MAKTHQLIEELDQNEAPSDSLMLEEDAEHVSEDRRIEGKKRDLREYLEAVFSD